MGSARAGGSALGGGGFVLGADGGPAVAGDGAPGRAGARGGSSSTSSRMSASASLVPSRGSFRRSTVSRIGSVTSLPSTRAGYPSPRNVNLRAGREEAAAAPVDPDLAAVAQGLPEVVGGPADPAYPVADVAIGQSPGSARLPVDGGDGLRTTLRTEEHHQLGGAVARQVGALALRELEPVGERADGALDRGRRAVRLGCAGDHGRRDNVRRGCLVARRSGHREADAAAAAVAGVVNGRDRDGVPARAPGPVRRGGRRPV